jgi:hypothetical protein
MHLNQAAPHDRSGASPTFCRTKEIKMPIVSAWKPKKAKVPTLCFILFATVFVIAQQPANPQALTNDDIVKMVDAHMDAVKVVQMINTQPGNYSLSAENVDQLKQQGVPDNVVAAMRAKAASATPATANSPDAHASTQTAPSSEPPCPAKEGAYYLEGSAWKPMSQVWPEGSSAHARPIPFAVSAKGVERFRDAVAPITLGPTPKFCLSTSLDIARSVVVALVDVKGDHREIQIAHAGQWSGSQSGIPEKKLQPMDMRRFSDNAILISTKSPLKPGQYMIFPLGQGGIGYDFGVQASAVR